MAKRRTSDRTPAGADEASVLGEGRFLRLVRRRKFEYVERRNAGGVVAVIALVRKRRLLLIEQYREAVQSPVIDLPAGLSGDIPGEEDEAFERAALRELEEETGYTAATCRRLLTLPTSPGLTSELVTLFRTSPPRKVSSGGGVGDENITVHAVLLTKFHDWIETQLACGKLVDPKVIVALALLARDGEF